MKAYRTVKNPVLVSLDGSAHDSSQRTWWLELVDNTVVNHTCETILRRAGLNEGDIQDSKKALLKTSFKFRAYYPKTNR